MKSPLLPLVLSASVVNRAPGGWRGDFAPFAPAPIEATGKCHDDAISPVELNLIT